MPKVQRFENEHRGVRAVLDELRMAVDQPSHADRERFATLLREFAGDLKSHFEFEEKGGLFRDIVTRAPRYDHQITQLLREHVEISEQFDGVVGLIDQGQTIDQVSGPLRQAIDALSTHERTENALVQDALLTDMGAAD